MKKISSITALGFLLILVPFAGIPREWTDNIVVVCGLVIVTLSFLIRRELHKVIRIFHNVEEIRSDTYVENIPQ